MSRRAVLAALLALPLVTSALGRAHGDSVCWSHGVEDLEKETFTGTMTVDRGAGPATATPAAWGFRFASSDMDGWSPIGRGDAVDASFALVESDPDRPSVEVTCARASYAGLALGQPIKLRAACGAVPSAGPVTTDPAAPPARLRVRSTYGLPSRDVWLVFDLAAMSSVSGVATVTAKPSLDANGEGTVQVEIALPETTLFSSAVVDVNDGLPIVGAGPVSVHLGATTLRGVATFDARADACPPESGGCDCGGPAGGWRLGGG
jgi:hypothetical protein